MRPRVGQPVERSPRLRNYGCEPVTITAHCAPGGEALPGGEDSGLCLRRGQWWWSGPATSGSERGDTPARVTVRAAWASPARRSSRYADGSGPMIARLIASGIACQLPRPGPPPSCSCWVRRRRPRWCGHGRRQGAGAPGRPWSAWRRRNTVAFTWQTDKLDAASPVRLEASRRRCGGETIRPAGADRTLRGRSRPSRAGCRGHHELSARGPQVYAALPLDRAPGATAGVLVGFITLTNESGLDLPNPSAARAGTARSAHGAGGAAHLAIRE